MIYWCGIFLLSTVWVTSIFSFINYLATPPQNVSEPPKKISLTFPSHEVKNEVYQRDMLAFIPTQSSLILTKEFIDNALLSEISVPDMSGLMVTEFASHRMQDISQVIHVSPPVFQTIETTSQSISQTPSPHTEKTDIRPLSPTYRVEPEYPSRALRRNIEGEVVLAFVTNSQGRPENIHVISANPLKIFDRAAINAVRQWKYAESHSEQTIKLVFEIEK